MYLFSTDWPIFFQKNSLVIFKRSNQLLPAVNLEVSVEIEEILVVVCLSLMLSPHLSLSMQIETKSSSGMHALLATAYHLIMLDV